MSPKSFSEPQTKYINAATQVRANVAISNLIKEAVVPLAAGKVTGGLPALKAFAQKAENFFGIEIPYADESPEKYRDLVGRAITANITALLNEGNRTVSDPDRERADEIGGLYAAHLLAPTLLNKKVLLTKLKAFEDSIQRNSHSQMAIMFGIERAWTGSLNNAYKDYGDILRQSRGILRSTAEARTPGSKRTGTVSWKDIITIDPVSKVPTYKSDWFRK